MVASNTSSLYFNKYDPPYASLIVIKHLPNFEKLCTIKESDCTSYKYKENILNEDVIIAKHFARIYPNLQLYGQNALEKSQIDYWVSVATFQLNETSNDILNILDNSFSNINFLVGSCLTLADIFVWIKFKKLGKTFQTEKLSQFSHILKWFEAISARPVFKDFQILAQNRPECHDTKITMEGGPQLLSKKEKKKDEGKFVELPGAEMGKVVVRFPPEASGYLHIGHAKAALLNQYYQNIFQGKLIMRFDDTNPAKENAQFEKEILHDLELLQVKGDVYTYTSDYFDSIQTHCERLIKDGLFYVDDTPAEVMKQEREARKASKNRENSIQRNMEMWGEMVQGSEFGQRCCVRAKIDMNSNNGCMRDPTMYRCKNEPHIKTGTKYRVYPTYDFACPIVDSVEGVTHALRTTEYHDRDEQYYWLCDALKIRKPHVWAYARLNMMHTVLSKRKLTWLVERGLVEGWDDPRLPTVRGILRRGLTVEGLKQFIVAQGSSKSVVTMEWDKIWSFNKKVIDPVAHRYVALAKDNLVDAYIEGVAEEIRNIPLHPKDASLGSRELLFGKHMLIDRDDAASFKLGDMVTFINLGNVEIKSIEVEPDNKIKSIDGTYVPHNVDFKNTTKITWLGLKEKGETSDLVPISCVKFDYIITKPVLGKDEDFKACINPNETWIEREYVGETALSSVQKSQIIQLLRLGYYICDSPYQSCSPNLCRVTPLRLFTIPDGHTKEMPSTGAKSREINLKASGEATKKVCVSNVPPAMRGADELDQDIKMQGDLVRKLKNAKASKADIEAQVKQLLALKNEYKTITGHDWKLIDKSTAVTSTQQNPGKASQSAEKPDLDVELLNEKIKVQCDLIRKLKNEKATKADIDIEVKQLLALKNEYKSLVGHDWKPNDSSNVITNAQQNPVQETRNAEKGNLDAETLNDKIKAHGDLIRKMKGEKASKPDIDSHVKQLLALKTQYKLLTGAEWTPKASCPQKETGDSKSSKEEIKSVSNVDDISKATSSLKREIKEQGDKIRNLKGQKGISKEVVSAEVNKLLTLKQQFKTATGSDWKPDMNINRELANMTLNANTNGHSSKVTELEEQIKVQGDKIRLLKSSKADKATLDSDIKRLLDLKAAYKEATGLEYKPPSGESQARSSQNQGKKDAKPPIKCDKKVEKVGEKVGGGPKKISRLGLEIGKDESFHDWYTQVITKAEMIEYYDVSGCYILRPWSYAIWEAIKDFFDAQIKKLGVQNVYFPIFVSQQALETEKSHIADFSPEVAWVTRSGDTELAEPIAIRPTSETVMYPAYAKWIKSYRDLPLKLNQWNNVVRWEFKHPTPFIRTREFLWQEGHSAFGTYKEAEEEDDFLNIPHCPHECAPVLVILDLYARIYEELLAVPVIRGRKTEKEKFAGGDYTTTVEAFIDTSGRGIQGATSHHLGQNFSKIFEIVCENPDTGDKMFVYQNSWGITTRTIGVMVMVHGDDLGLVLPPAVAPTQVVIIPCGISINLTDEDRTALIGKCELLAVTLNGAGIRTKADTRDNYSPGWKFNHWELKGIPLRIEIGPKELKNNSMMLARRDEAMSGGARQAISMTEDISSCKIVDVIKQKLKEIQDSMFQKAKEKLDKNLVTLREWDTFCQHLDQKHIILAPFCGEMDCEDQIKKLSTCEDPADTTGSTMGAKSLCIPFEQPRDIEEGLKCIRPDCLQKPKFYTLFGRSY